MAEEPKTLKSLEWDRMAVDVEFHPRILKSHYDLPVFQATVGGGFGRISARRCIGCGEVFPLEPCSNCREKGFVPGLTTQGVAGVFCHRCNKGFSSWKCQECGTDNPISKSLVMLAEKKGCFIATAVYGTANSVEVGVLKQIRDEYLVVSSFGRILVTWYYRFSPPIAHFLRHNGFIRHVVRILFVHPLVVICQLFLNKRR